MQKLVKINFNVHIYFILFNYMLANVDVEIGTLELGPWT